VHRGTDLAVEARQPFGGVRYLKASCARCLGAGDTRAGRRARQEQRKSWQTRLAPA
jgi:hypothetical protein